MRGKRQPFRQAGDAGVEAACIRLRSFSAWSWLAEAATGGDLRMSRNFALAAAIWLWGVQAMAADGLITMRSSHGPKDTMNRLEAQVKAKGMTVFARIDHAAGAAEVGLPLRPTELLIFGNAKAGTPLMQAEQVIGIDLPLKALVWQDEAGVTWLSYNDPTWLAKRHGLAGGTEAPARAMAAAMDGVARAAAGSP
jgi:uncharacterized protein (DUF302 family)